jgi:hypothetical protein
MKSFRNLIAIMMMGLLLTVSSPAQDRGKRPDQGKKETDRGVREENKNKGSDNDRRGSDRENKGRDERKKP